MVETKEKDILLISAEEIEEKERYVSLPEQGYVWR
jgi:hypothetical protein